MSLTALAVIGFLRTRRDEYSVWTRVVAPGIAALGLIALFVAIVINFDVLIGAAEPTVLSWLLPALVLVPGLVGTLWALGLRSREPGLYAGIGSGGSLG